MDLSENNDKTKVTVLPRCTQQKSHRFTGIPRNLWPNNAIKVRYFLILHQGLHFGQFNAAFLFFFAGFCRNRRALRAK